MSKTKKVEVVEEKVEVKKPKSKWIFLAVHKERIVASKDGYTIFKVGVKSIVDDLELGRLVDRTAILSNKFRKAKEGKYHIYFSIPETFVIPARLSEKNESTGRYDLVDEVQLSGWELMSCINADNTLLPKEPLVDVVDYVAKEPCK